MMAGALEIESLINTYCRIDPWEKHERMPVELDLGCGNGAYAMQLAGAFPDRLIVAADVMIGRLRKLAGKAARQDIRNMRVLRASNLDLAGFQLPDSAIRRAHILCPDPWPKKRHQGRRLITADWLGRMVRVLEPDGTLHIATDDLAYLSEIRAMLRQFPTYEEDEQLVRLQDVLELRTDFEVQWIKQGRRVPHLSYRVCKEMPAGVC